MILLPKIRHTSKRDFTPVLLLIYFGCARYNKKQTDSVPKFHAMRTSQTIESTVFDKDNRTTISSTTYMLIHRRKIL